MEIDENNIQETMLNKFSSRQNWTEKMAGLYREKGLIMDGAIYNSHIENEEFYAKVAQMIVERIRTKQKQERKDGFLDCIEDDRTRLSEIQNATKETKGNILEPKDIGEHINDEPKSE